MKRPAKIPAAILVAGYFLIKLKETVLHLLKEMPAPDFNNKYDSTML